MKYRTLPQKCALARAGKLRAILAGLLFFLPIFFVAGPVRADSAATEAARQLARKLAAQIDPKQTIYIGISDMTGSLSAAEISDALQACTTELHAYRFSSVPETSANVVVRVTLSEDLNNRLWVADFTQDGKVRAAIVPFAKSEGAASNSSIAPVVLIQLQMVFEQPGPILDFSITKRKGDAPTEIAVLNAGSVSVFDRSDVQWNLLRDQPIPRKAPEPRDPRGLLVIDSQGAGQASFAGGASCSFSVRGADSSMRCGSEGQPWVVHTMEGMNLTWSGYRGRNYFVSSDPKDEFPNEFYSLDVLDSGHQNLIATTGLDGRAWIRAWKLTPAVLSNQWGSDLASGGLECGNAPILLVTSRGDYTSADRIQPVAVRNLQADLAGAPVSFGGPVTALWGGPARAVVHNLKTGHYEAYQITLSCNH